MTQIRKEHFRRKALLFQGDRILALILVATFALFLFSNTIMHTSLPEAEELKQDFLTKHHKEHKQRKKARKASEKYSGDERDLKMRRKEMLEMDRKGNDPDMLVKYKRARSKYDAKLEQDSIEPQELYQFVNAIRKLKHEVHPDILGQLPYDVDNCPDYPPVNYPMEFPLLDLLNNWNPNNISDTYRPKIYQGLCRFDHKTELHKALNYRKAEVPFLIRDDVEILKVVQRWNTPNYLSDILGDTKYRTEYSESNSLMFFRERRNGHRPNDWQPPIKEVKLTYDEFVEKASQELIDMGPDSPHWYFRVNAKGGTDHFMFQELPFFLPQENVYIVDSEDTRGINCRFGMSGNTAAAHFDGSRNFVMLFGGERRYILSHPRNCKSLGLYKKNHPSARHTAVNWGNPNLKDFPEFAKATANEVVLQAGDVLYLPTQWFHHIISQDLNWQCNARSGITNHYQDEIKKCGF